MSAVPNIPLTVHRPPDLTSAQVAQDETANHESHGAFRMHDKPVENFRPIKVIVIGAGYSGVYHGVRIPEKIKNCELVIYEKNAGIGGAWFENRYPGCACDVPSHSYQYSFNPNPNWSSLYAPAAEIRAYIEETAKKFSVNRFVKLQHRVEGCRWDQQEGKWHVKIRKPDGEVFEDVSDVLINARGNLNNPSWPEIDGLKSFEGELMHSAVWNESYDFTNKRVGVIGLGSSAIQIIPNLRKTAGVHLNCFIRGRTWISPPFGQKVQDEMGMTSSNFSEEQRKRFRDDPEYFLEFRRKIEVDGNLIHPVTIRGTPMQKEAKKIFEQSMKERLASKPEIFQKLKPGFSPGCRRLTPGPGFLEALSEDNVSYIDTAIQRIEPKGIVTADGKLHEIDVLVCATGFHVSSAPPFPVTGASKSLDKHWATRASTYLSLATDTFPNMFIMLGPNAAIGSGSLTLMIEATGDYIVKCIRKLQKENYKSMTVRPGRVADFLAYADQYFQTTVFTDECRSWYRTGDKITGLWPGSTLHCIETLRSPRWEDFEYELRDEAGGNALAWMGNGYSALQMDEQADLAWYLDPRLQEIPRHPKPEDNELFKLRPFSY